MTGSIRGAVLVGLVAPSLMFAWVAWHEFTYAHGHPYAYGPANVIGVAGLAGGIVALCVLAAILAPVSGSNSSEAPPR